jgi:F-type H+-transporting ATPase subunit b
VDFDLSLFVIAALFWVGYAVLRAFFFKPLLAVMNRREARIDTARSAWEKATAEAEERLATERERLQQARRQATERRDALRREAQERRQALLEQAKAESQTELEKARLELGEQVANQRHLLASRAEALAGQIADRLLGRAV